MASRLEEDLCCPVCQEIFRDAVMLSCSHIFCEKCVQSWWREKEERECPVCKRRHSGEDVNPNVTLRSLCESSEELCSLHSEKLQLFCLDHQQPVCVVCKDSGKHAKHTFRPIDETVREHRQLMWATLEPFKEDLQHLLQCEAEFNQTADHIQAQTRHTEKQIKEQFQKLHQFLEEEEEARLSALRQEEEQKSQRMKEVMEALSREISALSDTVRDTEEQLRAGDVSFLKNYPTTAYRLQQLYILSPLEAAPRETPQLPPGVEIDVAKHLGNLSFNVWKKMKDLVSYSPVILDPNTADPELILSHDLTSVRPGDQQQPPHDPEKRRRSFSVQGCEISNSGTHSWDVEVGGGEYWEVGLKESPPERSNTWGQSWSLGFSDGVYETFSCSDPETVLSVQGQIQRVRVSLDWDKRKLSFSDPDTNAHIHTFTHTFTERVCPIITCISENPVRILPLKISVSLEPQ